MEQADVMQPSGGGQREHRLPLPDPRRADGERLLGDIDAVSHSPVVEALLSSANTILLVLNEQRQVVALNGRASGSGRPSDLLGLRLGEAFRCVHALAAGDCGAGPDCGGCGALAAILGCHRHRRPFDGECLIRTGGGAALEYDVRATPAVIESSRFTIVSLRDISAEKRRQALEQVFFHDVLNTVTGLRGWSELLRLSQGSHPGAPERIERLSMQIEREIRDHHALVLAEDGTLVPRPERTSASDALAAVEDVFVSHIVARGRRLEREVLEPVELETDPALLRRVLVNMVRNAFEATEPGGTVRLRCERIRAASPAQAGGAPRDTVRFSVHNEGTMPPQVQARLFQRAFSTKGQPGRGFGTYSMKLLGESYLGGRVSFVSGAEMGTVFQLDLPVAAARSSRRAHGGDPGAPGPSLHRSARD